LAYLGLNPNSATMHVHDLLHRRQPQSGSGLLRIKSLKQAKNPLVVFGVNAGAIVANEIPYFRVRARPANRDPRIGRVAAIF
jgi:hypothetical protein